MPYAEKMSKQNESLALKEVFKLSGACFTEKRMVVPYYSVTVGI